MSSCWDRGQERVIIFSFKERFIFKKNFVSVFVPVSIYVSHLCSGPHGNLRVSDLLEQELQGIVSYLMWLLGTKPRFSAGAVHC